MSSPHPDFRLLAAEEAEGHLLLQQHQRQHHHQRLRQHLQLQDHRTPASCPTGRLEQHNDQPPPQQQQHSAFLRLPSEIRLLIYSYLLPRNQDISFHPITRKHPATGAPVAGHAVQIPGIWASIGIWTSILRACRQTHDEGADALYGGNRFHFTLTSRERAWHTLDGGGPDALNAPYARGLPVNTLRTAALPAAALRRVRAASIRVEEDLARPEPFRRVRAWLQDAACRFGAPHAHRLQELRVELVVGEFRYGGFPSFTHDLFWEFRPEKNAAVACQFQFVLEPLAELAGIRNVEVRGHVSDSFARKLADRMMGERMDVEDDALPSINYGAQRVERSKRKRGSSTAVVSRTRRKFHEPELEWQLEGD